MFLIQCYKNILKHEVSLFYNDINTIQLHNVFAQLAFIIDRIEI